MHTRYPALTPSFPLQTALPDVAADPDLITLTEEAGLVRHFQEKLLGMCANLKLPHKVLSTSVNFMKRFYVKRSSLDADPQNLALVCLYLACKTEDCYLSAAELGRLVGVPAEALLRLELPLLQGLGFDLQVHSLYRALDGCLADLSDWISSGQAGGLSAEVLGAVRGSAYRAADRYLLTDAPLLHTPGQIGLAALRAGLKKHQEGAFEGYLQRVAGRSDGDAAAVVTQLSGVLDAIDALVAGGGDLEHDEVVEVDRRLKSMRKKLAATGAAAGKNKKAKGGG